MPFNGDLHLFAILNDPCPNNSCLACMITSIKEDRSHDPACILKAGDHPFIKRDSYVLYRAAHPQQIAHVRNMLAKKFYKAKDDFTQAVFSRIVAGLFESENTKGSTLVYARLFCT